MNDNGRTISGITNSQLPNQADETSSSMWNSSTCSPIGSTTTALQSSSFLGLSPTSVQLSFSDHIISPPPETSSQQQYSNHNSSSHFAPNTTMLNASSLQKEHSTTHPQEQEQEQQEQHRNQQQQQQQINNHDVNQNQIAKETNHGFVVPLLLPESNLQRTDMDPSRLSSSDNNSNNHNYFMGSNNNSSSKHEGEEEEEEFPFVLSSSAVQDIYHDQQQLHQNLHSKNRIMMQHETSSSVVVTTSDLLQLNNVHHAENSSAMSHNFQPDKQQRQQQQSSSQTSSSNQSIQHHYNQSPPSSTLLSSTSTTKNSHITINNPSRNEETYGCNSITNQKDSNMFGSIDTSLPPFAIEHHSLTENSAVNSSTSGEMRLSSPDMAAMSGMSAVGSLHFQHHSEHSTHPTTTGSNNREDESHNQTHSSTESGFMGSGSSILGANDSISSFLDVKPFTTSPIPINASSTIGNTTEICGSGQLLTNSMLEHSITEQQSHPSQSQHSNNIHESMNFSKLMKKADNTHSTHLYGQSSSSPSRVLDVLSEIPLEHSTQTQVLSNTVSSLHATSNRNIPQTSTSMSRTGIGGGGGRRTISRGHITFQTTSSTSFEVMVPITSNVTVREVIDVVSNPDLLRVWYEPVKALIVTEHRGRSIMNDNNSDTGKKRVSKNSKECNNMTESYSGDVIIGSAEEEEAIDSSQEREQHDGEWIQASTTALVDPQSHSGCIDSYVANSKRILGFPTTGHVTMFIERNRGQIGLTVGPFRNGQTLSHTISVADDQNEDGGCVKLVDSVKVLEKEEGNESFAASFCSCFDTMFDIIKEWTSPGIDGHVKQTITSMGKLRALIDNGGEVAAHSMNFGQVSVVSFIEDENDTRRPLLG